MIFKKNIQENAVFMSRDLVCNTLLRLRGVVQQFIKTALRIIQHIT